MRKSLVFPLVTLAFAAMDLPALAASCPATHLTNGTIADAMDVMAWFDCKAQNDNPIFNGSVGINVSPSYTFQVKGAGTTVSAISAPSGSDPGFRMQRDGDPNDIGFLGPPHWLHGSGSTTDYEVSSGEGNLILNTSASYNIIGSINTVEAWRTTPNGGLLVGLTSAWNSPNTKVEAKGTIAVSAWAVTGGDIALQSRVDDTAGYLAAYYYSTSLVGSVTTNGTTTAYNTTSDARLKRKVVDLSAAKADRALRAYHPQEYLLRGEPGIGALAQEVDQRFSAIGLNAEVIGLVTRGDSNLQLAEGEKGFRQWQMDNGKMVPFLVRAGGDHSDRIAALEAQNVKLARQVKGLLEKVSMLENANGNRVVRQAKLTVSGSRAR